MTKPLVSVIIIFYNAERFISEAIESVLNQTFSNWELLLIDDGSDDKSSSIAKSYSQQHPEKIFYHEHQNHENRGMSASRNHGIKFSKGEFITFLDADDLYLPNKLEEQLKHFEKYPNISCVFGATKLWFSWDPSTTNKDFVQTLIIPSIIYQPYELFKLFITQKSATPGICSLMIKRNLIEKINGFEEIFRGMYEDQVFYSKIALEAVCLVDNNSYDLYRQHKNSCSQKSISAGTVLLHKRVFLQWLQEYVRNKNIEDEEIHAAIKKELWLTQYPTLNYIRRRLLKQRRKYFPVKLKV